MFLLFKTTQTKLYVSQRPTANMYLNAIMTSNTTLFNSLLTIEQKYKGAKQIDIQ